MSDSVWPHRRQPPRLCRPWDSSGKNTGVGCHCLLRKTFLLITNSIHYFQRNISCDFHSFKFTVCYGYQGGKVGRGINREIGIDIYTLLCIKSKSPLDCKEIQPVHPKGNQSWIFFGRTDAEAETPILWPPDMKNWLTRKDPNAGKDWRQEKG